jgi:hypothetical protein
MATNASVQVTMFYTSKPIVGPEVTIHFPMPSGIRHPGGRSQRKARLRKKQLKYRLERKYSFCRPAYVEGCESVEVNGVLQQEVLFRFN